MSFDPDHIEDFLEYPFFIKWVKDPNSQSNQYWEKWISEHPDKRELFLEAQTLAKALRPKENNQVDSAKLRAGLDSLIAKNNERGGQERSTFPGKKKQAFLTIGGSIAASILLAACLLLSYSWFGNKEAAPLAEEAKVLVRSVPAGMKKTFVLPDSTQVTLNADSEIRYSSDFAINRKIHLRGEAFFDVKKDPKHPFTIQSGALTTVVLGTSFGVKAYPAGDFSHVAVLSGLVKVRTDNGIEAELKPDEAGFYEVETGTLRKGSYDYESLLGWKDKVLKFKNASYESLFYELSKWYDVQFIYENGIPEGGDYSGRYQDQSLKNVLDGISYATDLEFTLSGKKVSVRINSKPNK